MENNNSPNQPNPGAAPKPPTPPQPAPAPSPTPAPAPTAPATPAGPSVSPAPAAATQTVPQPAAPLPTDASATTTAMKAPKKRKKLVVGLIVGLVALVAIAVIAAALLLGGRDLGSLESRNFAEGEDYAYSVSFFEDAEISSPEQTLIASTLAVDVAQTRDDEESLTSVSYVVVEDIASAFELVGAQFTKQELYDIYLDGTANATLESIIVTTLSLDDVDIEGDVTAWSNPNFVDGIQAELSAETNEGVQLEGRVVFSIDENDQYGYTLVMLAPTATWNENTDTWLEMEQSLAQN